MLKKYSCAQLAPESAARSEVSACCLSAKSPGKQNEGFLGGQPLFCLSGGRPVTRPNRSADCGQGAVYLKWPVSVWPPSTPAAVARGQWSYQWVLRTEACPASPCIPDDTTASLGT